MTRMSKKAQRRAVSPRKRRAPGAKTCCKNVQPALGYKSHENALEGGSSVFIGKVK